jgi:type IV secretion system protein TrbL
MNRPSLIAAVLAASLALPSAALAAGDDPLLSGYGGPGSGDQAVLGGVVGGGGGKGGSGASAGGAAPSLRAATPAPGPGAPVQQGTTSSSSSASSSATTNAGRAAGKHHRTTTTHSSSSTTASSGTPAAAPALPQRVSADVRADRSQAGALFSTRDVLIALLVALAIAGLGVATSRLSRRLVRPSDARG